MMYILLIAYAIHSEVCISNAHCKSGCCEQNECVISSKCGNKGTSLNCTNHVDCLSGLCYNSTCAYNDANTCYTHTECNGGCCNNGYCSSLNLCSSLIKINESCTADSYCETYNCVCIGSTSCVCDKLECDSNADCIYCCEGGKCQSNNSCSLHHILEGNLEVFAEYFIVILVLLVFGSVVLQCMALIKCCDIKGPIIEASVRI